MGQELAKQEKPLIPGIGVAGLVLCPLFKGPCMKGGCEMWVELTCGDTKVARCSFAWLAVLTTETRSAIDRLRGIMSTGEKPKEEEPK